MVLLHKSRRYSVTGRKALTNSLLWNRIAPIVALFVKNSCLRFSLYVWVCALWGAGVFFLIIRHPESAPLLFFGLIFLIFAVLVFQQTVLYVKYVYKKKSAVHVELVDPFVLAGNASDRSSTVKLGSIVICNSMLFQDVECGNVSMKLEYLAE